MPGTSRHNGVFLVSGPFTFAPIARRTKTRHRAVAADVQRVYPKSILRARIMVARALRGELVRTPDRGRKARKRTDRLRHHRRKGYLDQLVVSPEHWGSSSTSLVDEAKRRSPDGITLLVNKDNAAHRFTRQRLAHGRGCESDLRPAVLR